MTEGKGGRRKKKKGSAAKVAVNKDQEHGFSKPTAPVVHEVNVPETISVSDLAQRMSVKAGEVIAIIGNTGELTTGPHLHFELWSEGYPVNPTDYIDFE